MMICLIITDRQTIISFSYYNSNAYKQQTTTITTTTSTTTTDIGSDTIKEFSTNHSRTHRFLLSHFRPSLLKRFINMLVIACFACLFVIAVVVVIVVFCLLGFGVLSYAWLALAVAAARIHPIHCCVVFGCRPSVEPSSTCIMAARVPRARC